MRAASVERELGRGVHVDVGAPLREHRRGQVGDGDAQMPVAEVDAQHGARLRRQPQQRRWPPASLALGLDLALDHHPALQQRRRAAT